jgi:hypothetical protein
MPQVMLHQHQYLSMLVYIDKRLNAIVKTSEVRKSSFMIPSNTQLRHGRHMNQKYH